MHTVIVNIVTVQGRTEDFLRRREGRGPIHFFNICTYATINFFIFKSVGVRLQGLKRVSKVVCKNKSKPKCYFFKYFLTSFLFE